jgi:DNA-binding response OmpR family regulator
VEVVGSPRPMSVLIVEDQPDVAETLRLFLELCGGYALTVAGDGEAGVRAALAHPPGAVICDIGLPKKDGFQVAEELAARLASTPLLIAVTGYADQVPEELARDAGFDHLLAKPADPAALGGLIRAHTGPGPALKV